MTRPKENKRLRMKDLCTLTGLSRQAIHFYIQQGLIPEGHKTGRNMAYYEPAHVERLQTIRRLQDEHFLPLRAIKAVLDGEDHDGFTEPQKQLFRELKPHMQKVLSDVEEPDWRKADDIAGDLDLQREDVERLVELGFVTAKKERGKLWISGREMPFIELLAQLRKIGFTEELGFTPEDLQVYEEGLGLLFKREKEMIASRLVKLPPDQIVPMLEKALPIIHAFFARYHTEQVRNFFKSVR